ncbi:MAG: ArsS family sensor histidine kinase [Sulfurospirillaceae bacterium]|nr:ArsS family sensor histidine kinase [Sulfurospirillaceae bacterium]MDD2825666.1 ArsS family sensor histidine kinase [Sulfurospirillaceae bacterium]
MSIFTKVMILFLVSLSLMMVVSQQTNTITQSKIEILLKEKYKQASNELFTYFSNNDKVGLTKKLEVLNFKVISHDTPTLLSYEVIYENATSFGEIKILRDTKKRYLLFMSYLDETLLVQDASQEESFLEKDFLGYLIFADILILLVIFLLILKILSPLKKLSHDMQRFGDGALNVRMNDMGKNELGTLSRAFNNMAENIETLIHSRQRLLRDVGHELRTPIAKAKLALEMLPESRYESILKKSIFQIDKMTAELLSIEKLNAKNSVLKTEKFNTETLIFESLSKLVIENESWVEVHMHETFDITGDLNYLSIALKNLIDNALKYATQKPIVIEVTAQSIAVKSQGEPLKHSIAYYCEAFVQEDHSRGQEGFGLGLSIVKKILDAHQMRLTLTCKEGWNSFAIHF